MTHNDTTNQMVDYNSALSLKYSKLPEQPALNGGLYTGEPFMKNAPWRNFPSRPEVCNMIYNNLRRMNVPPSEALYHFPGGGLRPGNNTPELPSEYLKTVTKSDTNHMCVPKPRQDMYSKPQYGEQMYFNHMYLGQ